jgi:peptidyl-prolyl cis-trans isomerase SurA
VTRSIWTVAVVIGLGLVAAVFHATAQAEEEIIDRVAAVVGRDVILQSEIDEYLQIQLLEAGIRPDAMSESETIEIRCNILKSMVDDRLIVTKARLDSIEVTPQEVEAQLRQQFSDMKSRFPTEEAFQQQIEREGTSERELRNKLRKQMERYLLRERLLGQMTAEINVTFHELEEFYEANRDSMPTIPATVTLAHITRVARAGDSSLVASRKHIEAAVAKLDAGEAFDAVARELSQDPGTAPVGGNLGWFGRGEMVPEFEAIAFSLDSGAVSAPILTEFGLHLIQNLGHRDNQVQARHILARSQPNEADEIANRDTMISVYERLTDDADFNTLARRYSMDPSVQQTGGRIGPVSPQDLPTPFGRSLSTLEAGDVSYPFESTSGSYHIVKLIERTREHRMNLQDDRRRLEDAVKQQKLGGLVEEILQRERDRTYVETRLSECADQRTSQ